MAPAATPMPPTASTVPVLSTTLLSPAASANGTVRPSLRPIIRSVQTARDRPFPLRRDGSGRKGRGVSGRSLSSCSGKAFETFTDDGQAFVDALQVDAQWRRQANDMAVGRLRQQAIIAEAEAELPGCVFFLMLDHNRV